LIAAKSFLGRIQISPTTKTVLIGALIVWGIIAPFLILFGCDNPHRIGKISILEKIIIVLPAIIKDKAALPESNNATKNFFIDTPGCRMPKLDIMNRDIAYYISDKWEIKCGHEKPLTSADNDAMWIGLSEKELAVYYNVTDVGLLTCYYWKFDRVTDKRNKYHNTELRTFYFGDRVNVTDEYVKVICGYDKRNNIYEFSHIFLPKPAKSEADENKDRNANSINVMVYGIDSVSRLNFYRQMNETLKLLKQLGAMELQGYSKVDDNTYPNLIPVLTGHNVTELEAKCLPSYNSTFDECPILWNTFKQKGYKTLFAEDNQFLGLFKYERGGFKNAPTDLYPRNYFLDMERTIGSKQLQSISRVCLGHRKVVDVFVDYLKRVTDVYKREALFSFFWTCAMTHDYLESVVSIDNTTRNMIGYLNETNYLNSTVLVLMSDHGLRFGSFRRTYQGMIEERQPFLYMLAPEWYQSLYPLAFSNFRKNSNKLTTHFDLHETLKDISNPLTMTDDAIRQRSVDLLQEKTIPRGISLFLTVPTIRTCELAAIASHWCTCHDQKKLPTNSKRAKIAAKALVQHINKLLEKYPQCQKLHLNQVFNANVNYVKKSRDGKNKFRTNTEDVQVTLETRPGLATFEGTIRLDERADTMLTAPISRTNKYGDQSWCVDDATLKLYCYC
jgi:hypothetical protein